MFNSFLVDEGGLHLLYGLYRRALQLNQGRLGHVFIAGRVDCRARRVDYRALCRL
jgi:hypothetical protein